MRSPRTASPRSPERRLALRPVPARRRQSGVGRPYPCGRDLRAAAPYAERNVVNPPAACIGCVSRSLAVAAALEEQWSQAEHHFEEALRANSRMGARPWVARTSVDWAECATSGARGRATASVRQSCSHRQPSSRASWAWPPSRIAPRRCPRSSAWDSRLEAKQIAPSARASAPRGRVLGSRVRARCLPAEGLEGLAVSRSADSRNRGPSFTPSTSWRRAWSGSGGSPIRARPRRPGLGDAGAILDARAKAEYRRRLAELEEEVEEARAFGDDERAARAAEEREFLVAELAARSASAGGTVGQLPPPSVRASASPERSARLSPGSGTELGARRAPRADDPYRDVLLVQAGPALANRLAACSRETPVTRRHVCVAAPHRRPVVACAGRYGHSVVRYAFSTERRIS